VLQTCRTNIVEAFGELLVERRLRRNGGVVRGDLTDVRRGILEPGAADPPSGYTGLTM